MITIITWFYYPVECAIQLLNQICHLKLPNFQNHLIFVTQLSGRYNYPTQFAIWNLQIYKINWFSFTLLSGRSNYPTLLATWHLQITLITWFLSPCLSGRANYPTQFTTWNLQIATITWFLSPDWVGDPITQPDLSTKISKFPKLPDFCHLVEWAIQLPNPIYHLKSPNFQNYPICVTRLSGRSNYPTWFTTWNLHIARSLSPGWVDDPITLPFATHIFRWQYNQPPWFINIPSEISTNQLLDLVLGIYHIYILVVGIILLPSSPFHIQYKFWNLLFHHPPFYCAVSISPILNAVCNISHHSWWEITSFTIVLQVLS
jgi:hypothetical protein